MKINLFFILWNIFIEIQSLVELPVVEDNSIAITVIAIQNTVNNLFTSLKIRNVRQSLELKQYFTIHNLFVSITLRDCDSWKKIVSLSRVNDIDNKTIYFITQINEVLNEGVNDKTTDAIDNNIFVERIEYLKEWYTTKRYDFVNSESLNNFNRNLLKYEAKYNNNKTNDESKDTILNNEFWQPSGRRIYKGSRTHIKDFPFMASVQFFGTFQCAGSIIKSDLIITAASCLQLAWNNRFYRENPSYLTVQIGSHFYQYGGEIVQVQEIYFHPKYDPKTLRHNIAVMRLSRKIIFKTKTRRVKKIDYDRKARPLIAKDRITIIGWGAKDHSNVIYDVAQNRLSFAELDFYPLEECQEYYSKQYVTKKNFCAGFFSVGGGACNRDVGGPGVIDGTLMGVISFASPVCGGLGPTVFTKVGYYADWIDDIMKQDVPSVSVATTKLLPKIYYKYINTETATSVNNRPFGDTTSPWEEPLRIDKNLGGLRTVADKNYDIGKMLPILSNEKNRYNQYLDITSKLPPTHDKRFIDLPPYYLPPSTIGRGNDKYIQVTSKIKKEKPRNTFGTQLGVEMTTEPLLNKVKRKLINNLDIDRIVKSIEPALLKQYRGRETTKRNYVLRKT